MEKDLDQGKDQSQDKKFVLIQDNGHRIGQETRINQDLLKDNQTLNKDLVSIKNHLKNEAEDTSYSHHYQHV